MKNRVFSVYTSSLSIYIYCLVKPNLSLVNNTHNDVKHVKSIGIKNNVVDIENNDALQLCRNNTITHENKMCNKISITRLIVIVSIFKNVLGVQACLVCVNSIIERRLNKPVLAR